jgi:hypothetical protein
MVVKKTMVKILMKQIKIIVQVSKTTTIQNHHKAIYIHHIMTILSIVMVAIKTMAQQLEQLLIIKLMHYMLMVATELLGQAWATWQQKIQLTARVNQIYPM